ncbi:sucrase ferredoxin [Nocardioides sp.]|uniref:sucrase ferredoxin n=1 Tax=Nocardioides sp. TaxID=35761 RepID=UPI001A324D66|nr:sucrase ferredoxin [Nocardioides sp.]MBJ7357077.1 sucrase ferredoxin [Nocardioides sp.]
MSFRCAAASLLRDEPAAGTASTVRAFLLLENPGPWGENALRDARLPDGLGDELTARASAARVRVLLIRRPGRQRPSEGLRVFAAYAHHTEPWLETTVLGDVHEVHDLDVEALGAGRSPGLTPQLDPVFAVCTHGRHDTCCAERGRPVAAALAERHPEQTWEVSHIGGDRFAANAVVLPHGLYYGRLDAESAVEVAAAQLAGRVSLAHLRGRSGLGMPLQYAEIALRTHLGETTLAGVRFTSRTATKGADGDVVTARFAARGATYAVTVRTTLSAEPQQLTCSAARDSRFVEHELLDLSVVGDG